MHICRDIVLGLKDEKGLSRLADLHVKRDALIVDGDPHLRRK